MNTQTELLIGLPYIKSVLQPVIVPGLKGPVRLDLNAANPLIAEGGARLLPPMIASAVCAAAAFALSESAPAGTKWDITAVHVDFDGEILHQAFVEADLSEVDWRSSEPQAVPVSLDSGTGEPWPVRASVAVALRSQG